MPYTHLTDRSLLTVTGEPAEHFLQVLITADLVKLGVCEARPSALLTPQGKILFDFLISRIDGGFRLDCAASSRDALLKRLTLYRLRTKVDIETSDEPVFAAWGLEKVPDGAVADRRFADDSTVRFYGSAPVDLDGVSPEEYVAHRVRAGVAEAEADFPADDVYPHDVLMDQNAGVSFAKGCFVGQEVVSRMQHRGTARRRLMIVRGEGHLGRGVTVTAEGKAIGTVIAATGDTGMALMRIDRLAQALARGAVVAADGVPVETSIPPWAGYALPSADAATRAGEDE
ncbi:YgfZ/GcvT domain-containing protein [Consotaella aegiceratis]|uniref:CAF17-like 4Fe-4S cluster assembly/insertion protein YgfZ n=1 Tax=Consotaella aegiceratis TaxID=3097961 RepID=UPI002F425C74